MIITMGGDPGAGKSTVLKLLEKERFHIISSGEIFRAKAAELMMTLEEFGKYVDEHPEVDMKIDDEQNSNALHYMPSIRDGWAHIDNHCVVDGRMAGKLIYHADLRVWLTAPIDVRAERIAKREGIDIEEAYESTRMREISELVRYKKYYDRDMRDLSTYSLVVDTTKLSPEQVAKLILDAAFNRRD